MSNTFSWKTKFKSIIIVDGELFANEYSIKLFITPYTANLKEQTEYFDRLKNLFEMVMANTITCLLYTSPSPRDLSTSRMPSSA